MIPKVRTSFGKDHAPTKGSSSVSGHDRSWQILLQKSKTERLQKSRESRFSSDSNAAKRRGTDTQVRGDFSEKRYGPSRRHVQHAPAPLKIFVRHPKKTFAT